MFFLLDLEKNSSLPEGSVFSRPDVPGSDISYFVDLKWPLYAIRYKGAEFKPVL